VYLLPSRGKRAADWWLLKEAAIAFTYALFIPRSTDGTRSMFMREGVHYGRAVVVNCAAFVAFWLLGFTANRVFSDLPVRETMQAVATGAAVLLAIRIRAQIMAYFLSAMLAFNVAELAVHSIWGGAVRGAQTHFAIMGAGLIGVALGALLFRHLSRPATARAEMSPPVSTVIEV
jgi:hypothetical protein